MIEEGRAVPARSGDRTNQQPVESGDRPLAEPSEGQPGGDLAWQFSRATHHADVTDVT
jgi:hypothetical protein